ncbi:helix-turn-helix domain-containing protein [Streptomyces sp. B21-106]|uniref:helix-turn-helix domain-containing protein n=1 Tax=Streptomyces sp. B21-106 TaxID=3039418 RepID=UPI002FEF859B
MASIPSPRWAPLPIGLGAMLRSARLRAGFSRERLAAVVQASPGQVQGVEGERRPPSVEVAERISAALRLDPWEAAVLLAAAVEAGQLRSRRGVRQVRRRGTPVPPWVQERIAFERAAGRSWQAIADGLNSDGVPTMERGRWWASSVSQAASGHQGERQMDPVS